MVVLERLVGVVAGNRDACDFMIPLFPPLPVTAAAVVMV